MTMTAQAPQEAVAAWGKQLAEARRHAYGHAVREVREDGTQDVRISRPRCPYCKGTATVGVTVGIRHEMSCPRSRDRVRQRPQYSAGQVPQRPQQAARLGPAPASGGPEATADPAASRPTYAPGRPQRLDGRERHPHRHGRQRRPGPQRRCEDTPQAPGTEAEDQGNAGSRPWAGVRPWVVARWFVSGCRVKVQGWLATVRRIIRGKDGELKVHLDFDDWPRDQYREIEKWWALDYLDPAWVTYAGSARAAA